MPKLTFEEAMTDRQPIELTFMEIMTVIAALELAPQNATIQEPLVARLADALLERGERGGPVEGRLRLVA